MSVEASSLRLTVSRPEDAMLRVEDATVVFDGFKALDIDRFAVRQNEVRVVIGPNGAGKTTLCDVISGKTRLRSGRIFFNGADISRFKDFEIARLGVGRKFQTPAVFGSLTVQENLELAAPISKSVLPALFRKTSPGDRDKIREVIAAVGLESVIDVQAQYLSHGQRQSLEIGTLLVSSPKLLLIDEPAAGLSDEETSTMATLIRKLAEGHTVIVIEHDMGFVRQLEADITVLNEGRILAEGPMSAVQADPRVVEAYLGR
ncbi:MAG TPA: urea ABC transporter ATP-binding protein UrtD [Terriglobia bacterium]|nr:urea ABC transporter ATP-binding protein UrtD [Terriglobia bacterium]